MLNLDRNRLAQFPVGISQLFNLRQLNLSDSQIKSLPSSINDLTRLEHFWCSRNYLKQISIEL
ncbi:hypothetical protein CMK15_11960 [Candidatus Poribacteria bacterium]|nr:hypothetical protein [Candidatus Poribacteria bacterium]